VNNLPRLLHESGTLSGVEPAPLDRESNALTTRKHSESSNALTDPVTLTFDLSTTKPCHF